MTVIQPVHVLQRTWRGYDDPGLPVGMWFSQGAVLGDASGGQANLQMEFRDAANRSARFFSLEQIEVHHTTSSGRSCAMIATNWEQVSEFGLINRQWKIAITSNSNGVAALDNTVTLPLPIFLGITTPVSELPSILTINCANTDGETFFSTVQGYIWEPRSVLAEGGLRRPADSLYGGGVN